MEILLAVVVIAAVIFFGALISAGNERQRKAIDGLREQVVQWAVQDLRIKRERLASEVKVDDPMGWLNTIASKACGYKLNLELAEVVEEPDAIICINHGVGNQVVFSPHSPKDLEQLMRGIQSRLSRFGEKKRIISLLRDGRAFEASVLNAGILFDLEIPVAWKKLTGRDTEGVERLWVYHQSAT